VGSFIIRTHHQILLGRSNEEKGDRQDMQLIKEKNVKDFGRKARRKATIRKT
jgi:hypothetical protein